MATLPTALVGGSNYAVYDNYYQLIDISNRGTIGALEAATFLKKSGLSDAKLSKIWDIADANGKGYLTKSGFFTALKLVALVQAGYDISTNNLTIDVPPPNMGSGPITPTPSSNSILVNSNSNKISPAIPPIPTTIPPALPVHSTSEWAMKPEERMKYDKLFDSLQPSNGVVPGNKVKGMLMDSKLSVDTLGKIWDLADMDKDGALNRHEFCVAMHLVYKALEKYTIPSCLPPELLPPEKRKDSASLPGAIPVLPVIPNGVRSITPDIVKITSPSFAQPLIPSLTSVTSKPAPLITPPPISSPTPLYSTTPLIPVHTSIPTVPVVPYSSVNVIPTISSSSLYYSTQFISAASFAQRMSISSQDDDISSSIPWVITAEEKLKYDILFNQADLDKDGYVSGNEIKNVFLQSGVAQSVLAHIWSLCDTAEEGKLNSEQFALALWLISRKLRGVEPPATLAPEMIPPSCRKQAHSLPRDNFVPVSDPEIDELSKNIQKLLEERSSVEMEIGSRRNDITGKVIEVENLQGELNALLATLKQLEMQKQEAQKRLNDLQKQTTELQNELDTFSKQIEVQEEQVDKLKAQAVQQEEVIKAHEEELSRKKKELEELNKEEENVNKKCVVLEQEIEHTLKLCDDYKQKQEKVKKKIATLEEFKSELESAISNLEAVIDTNDISILVESNLEIEPKYKDPLYSIDTDVPTSNVVNFVDDQKVDAVDGASHNSINGMGNVDFSNAFQNDPFASRPSVDTGKIKQVGTPDPFASEEIFDANFNSRKTDFNEDPFAPAGKHKKSPFDDEGRRNPTSPAIDQQREQDPFGCDPFAILHAPPKVSSNTTTPSPRSESPSPALPPKKSKQPPPRPAPPRPAPPSLHQSGFDADFADFSGFSKIPVVTSFSASNSPLTIKEPLANKDPFRDYRYEDPFAIETDYMKMAKTDSINGSQSSSSLQQHKSVFNAFELSDDPFSSGTFTSATAFSSSTTHKPFNDVLSKSTPVSPLPSEDQQLAWATTESVKLEEQRKKLSVQEKADLKLALKLSKSENKKKKSSKSKILL